MVGGARGKIGVGDAIDRGGQAPKLASAMTRTLNAKFDHKQSHNRARRVIHISEGRDRDPLLTGATWDRRE